MSILLVMLRLPFPTQSSAATSPLSMSIERFDVSGSAAEDVIRRLRVEYQVPVSFVTAATESPIVISVSRGTVQDVLDQMTSTGPYRYRTVGGRLVVYPDEPKYTSSVSVPSSRFRGVPRLQAATAYAELLAAQAPGFETLLAPPILGDPNAPAYTEPVTLEDRATVLEHLVQILGRDPNLMFGIVPAPSGLPVLTFYKLSNSDEGGTAAVCDACCPSSITYANERNVACGDGKCGAGIAFDVTGVVSAGSCEGEKVTETVTNDQGCGRGDVMTGAGCVIGADNKITNCADTYKICAAPAYFKRLGGCTGVLTQKLYVCGKVVETVKITFVITVDEDGNCSGTASRQVAKPRLLGGIAASGDLKDITCLKAGNACANPPRYQSGQSVARLTSWFTNDVTGVDSMVPNDCSGFAVDRGGRKDLLLTSKDCLSRNGYTLRKVQAEFNAEYADCQIGGPSCDPPGGGCSGGPFLEGHLFYTDPTSGWGLVKLDTNAPATIPLASADAAPGDSVYVPQHPAGRCKEIADGAVGALLNANQFAHQIPTEGGSAGSPMLLDMGGSPQRYTVVGIHEDTGSSCVASRGVRVSALLRPSGNTTRLDSVIAALDAVPVEVSDLEALSDENGIRLDWRLADATRLELTGVTVQRADALQGPFADRTSVPLLPARVMSFADHDVEAGHAYWYRLELQREQGPPALAGPISIEALGSGPANTTLSAPVVSNGGLVTIRYTIAGKPKDVRLALYDVSGRLIRALEEPRRGPGAYARTWDRHDENGVTVPRGVYLVRLTAGDVRLTKKMVLVFR